MSIASPRLYARIRFSFGAIVGYPFTDPDRGTALCARDASTAAQDTASTRTL
jgi:hypothetical protein